MSASMFAPASTPQSIAHDTYTIYDHLQKSFYPALKGAADGANAFMRAQEGYVKAINQYIAGLELVVIAGRNSSIEATNKAAEELESVVTQFRSIKNHQATIQEYVKQLSHRIISNSEHERENQKKKVAACKQNFSSILKNLDKGKINYEEAREQSQSHFDSASKLQAMRYQYFAEKNAKLVQMYGEFPTFTPVVSPSQPETAEDKVLVETTLQKNPEINADPSLQSVSVPNIPEGVGDDIFAALTSSNEEMQQHINTTNDKIKNFFGDVTEEAKPAQASTVLPYENGAELRTTSAHSGNFEIVRLSGQNSFGTKSGHSINAYDFQIQPSDCGSAVTVIHGYKGRDSQELTLNINDTAELIKIGKRGWVLLRLFSGNKLGWYPTKYIRLNESNKVAYYQ